MMQGTGVPQGHGTTFTTTTGMHPGQSGPAFLANNFPSADMTRDGFPDVRQLPQLGNQTGAPCPQGFNVTLTTTTASQQPTVAPLAPATGPVGVGVDLNRDGVPDVFQRPASAAPSSYAPPSVVPAPVMAVTGVDMNRDGIPDVLQRQAPYTLTGSGAPVSYAPAGSAAPSSCAPVASAPRGSFAPVASAPRGSFVPIGSPSAWKLRAPCEWCPWKLRTFKRGAALCDGCVWR